MHIQNKTSKLNKNNSQPGFILFLRVRLRSNFEWPLLSLFLWLSRPSPLQPSRWSPPPWLFWQLWLVWSCWLSWVLSDLIPSTPHTSCHHKWVDVFEVGITESESSACFAYRRALCRTRSESGRRDLWNSNQSRLDRSISIADSCRHRSHISDPVGTQNYRCPDSWVSSIIKGEQIFQERSYIRAAGAEKYYIHVSTTFVIFILGAIRVSNWTESMSSTKKKTTRKSENVRFWG